MAKTSTDSLKRADISVTNPHFFKVTSIGQTALTLLVILHFGLLPGLLAVCSAYVLTRWVQGPRRLTRFQIHPYLAATIVIALPVHLLIGEGLNARGMLFGAVAQYQTFLQHMAETILQIRSKLPELNEW